MASSEGYREWLKPYLEVKLREAFPDPASFRKEEEFVYAAKVSSVFKKVVAEILSSVEAQITTANYLSDKKEGKIKEKFSIGKE